MQKKVEVTVQRPSGEVETVIHPHITYMTPKLWDEVVANTRKAGRGEPIRYQNITETPEPSAADKAYSQVVRMYRQAEDLRDRPGAYFPALQRAEAAKAEWEAQYPEAAREMAEQDKAIDAKDKARREEEYKTSFIARGLD